MKEMFLSFELSEKLKEKGFTCKYPFAMYDEYGQFCPLFTSADEYVDGMGFMQREVFNFDNFFEKDIIAPTIEQVLNWLVKEKRIFVNIDVDEDLGFDFFFVVYRQDEITWRCCGIDKGWHTTYESAAVAGIEYVLDNLI